MYEFIKIQNNINKICELYQKVTIKLLGIYANNMKLHNCVDYYTSANAYIAFVENLFKRPDLLIIKNIRFLSEVQMLTLRMNEQNKAHSYSYQLSSLKAMHALYCSYSQEVIESLDINCIHKRCLMFLLKHFCEFVNPDNTLFFNEIAIEKAIKTHYQSIIDGLINLLSDMENCHDIFTIAKANAHHKFKIGIDIAATDGKVVMENKLMQLICYKPNNITYQKPILVVPPCINKYYILDLSEDNSFIKWLVNNNFQVFLISWVNPNVAQSDLSFDDYIKYGLIDVCEFLATELSYKSINAIGYCIGGTFLACYLAYERKHKKSYINSATFLTTLLDFTDTGDIGLFVNKNTYSDIERTVSEYGYVSGSYLSNMFSVLRSKDLIWAFILNNYILGNKPAQIDIFFWNADVTNLPNKMYLEYIYSTYVNNCLIERDKFSVCGAKIDLSHIDVPTFFLAAESDHIAPWKSVYKSMLLLNNNKNSVFCLTGSGHVMGVINPPYKKKYHYYVNSKCSDEESWLHTAEKIPGSWWDYWIKWQQRTSGKVSKCTKYENIKSIEDAPGRYVRESHHM